MHQSVVPFLDARIRQAAVWAPTLALQAVAAVAASPQLVLPLIPSPFEVDVLVVTWDLTDDQVEEAVGPSAFLLAHHMIRAADGHPLADGVAAALVGQALADAAAAPFHIQQVVQVEDDGASSDPVVVAAAAPCAAWGPFLAEAADQLVDPVADLQHAAAVDRDWEEPFGEEQVPCAVQPLADRLGPGDAAASAAVAEPSAVASSDLADGQPVAVLVVQAGPLHHTVVADPADSQRQGSWLGLGVRKEAVMAARSRRRHQAAMRSCSAKESSCHQQPM